MASPYANSRFPNPACYGNEMDEGGRGKNQCWLSPKNISLAQFSGCCPCFPWKEKEKNKYVIVRYLLSLCKEKEGGGRSLSCMLPDQTLGRCPRDTFFCLLGAARQVDCFKKCEKVTFNRAFRKCSKSEAWYRIAKCPVGVSRSWWSISPPY